MFFAAVSTVISYTAIDNEYSHSLPPFPHLFIERIRSNDAWRSLAHNKHSLMGANVALLFYDHH